MANVAVDLLWMWFAGERASARNPNPHDDDDAEPTQDKLRRKGLIQPPGDVSGPPQA